ncbi:hypothetical protein KQX64_07015 [Rhodopseudomonas palustris]|nr:hypothetical protein KQX64_07015 [Rhodopseudomonas palustris]
MAIDSYTTHHELAQAAADGIRSYLQTIRACHMFGQRASVRVNDKNEVVIAHREGGADVETIFSPISM